MSPKRILPEAVGVGWLTMADDSNRRSLIANNTVYISCVRFMTKCWGIKHHNMWMVMNRNLCTWSLALPSACCMVHLQSQRIQCHMVTHCHLITLPLDYNTEWSSCSHNAYGATWLHTATWLHSAMWLQYWMVHLQSQCIQCHMVTQRYTVPRDYNTEWSTCSHNAYGATWLHSAMWWHKISFLSLWKLSTYNFIPIIIC